MTTIRVAHIADVHISPKNLYKTGPALEEAVTKAIAMGAELAVFAGDTFDASMGIHEPAVVFLVQQLRRLADAMPVVVIQGTFSHDRLGSLDLLQHVSSRIYIETVPRHFHLDIGGRVVEIVCLPSTNKAGRVGGKTAQENLDTFQDHVEAARRAGYPSILIAHGTVLGSVTESGHAMVSPDHEFTAEQLLASGASAVMLGHIHRHQSFPDVSGRVIAYAGSLARLVYGQTAPTGFLLWDVGPESATFEFVPVKSPKMIALPFDGPPDIEAVADAAGESDGAEVLISWQVDEEHRHSVDKDAIRLLFSQALDLKLVEVVNPIQRVRAEGIGARRSLVDCLGVWAETTGTSMDGLVVRLGMLQENQTVEELLND